MSILGKLAFWKKKEDEFNFDDLATKEMTHPDPLGLGQSPLDSDEKSPFPETHQEMEPKTDVFAKPASSRSFSPSPSNDLELINSKLDTIKALLNSLDQRLANVERSAETEKKQNRLW